MIEREAIPKLLRGETTTAFCDRHGISRTTYYNELQREENWQKVEELCFKQAKKHTATILDNLGHRAESDTKSAEIFLKFVLERTEKKDLKIGGELKAIVEISKEGANKYGLGYDPAQSTGGDTE